MQTGPGSKFMVGPFCRNGPDRKSMLIGGSRSSPAGRTYCNHVRPITKRSMSQSTPATIRRPSALVLACCAAFVAANIAIPLTLGDVYPFTVAPMFCDAPQAYCNYRVYDPDGKLLADN